MSTVQIKWQASNQLIAQELKETGTAKPATRYLELNLAELTPGQREALLKFTTLTGGYYKDSGPTLKAIEIDEYETPSDECNTGRWAKCHSLLLDTEPDFEKVLQLAEFVANRKADVEPHRAQKEAEWDARQKAEREKDKESKQKRLEREEAERKRREMEKVEWVESSGSAHLKRAFGAGYDCQRLYVTERAAMEAMGFTVDFDDNARWKSRCEPSETALDAEEAADALGIGNANIVWMVGSSLADPSNPDYYDAEDFEAVIITQYLGKYTLVKPIES